MSSNPDPYGTGDQLKGIRLVKRIPLCSGEHDWSPWRRVPAPGGDYNENRQCYNCKAWDKLQGIAVNPEPEISHPNHYTWLPNNIEVIDITSHFSFVVGNALKYIMRHQHKGNPLADLKKARWYIDYEIKRIEGSDG